MLALSLLIAAYLLGAIPFGFLITKVFGRIDIRTIGSGNIGARNVGRALGLKYAAAVFILDLGKGFVPVFLSILLSRSYPPGSLINLYLPFVAGLFSVLGHNWSIFLSFGGGKGVSTSLGVLLCLFCNLNGPDQILTYLIYSLGLLILLFTRHRKRVLC